jgi:polyphosphate kinase
LIVAPSSLRPELSRRIAEQGRPGGRIVMKMNALVDPELIDALYDAAAKGAEIDLLIRGICCLRPGVPGLSERIRVRSIVGRFLEHSRIFRFGPVDRPAEYLIGSADLMPRNLDRRIEALLTVTGPTLQARLDEILEVGLADDVGSWELTADGTWRTVRTGMGIESQRRLQELALARVQARAAQAQSGGSQAQPG